LGFGFRVYPGQQKGVVRRRFRAHLPERYRSVRESERESEGEKQRVSEGCGE